MSNGYDASGDGRKIFVGGLSWETTENDLRDYFTKYGGVSECTLKTDPATGRSRGFGFVLFDESGSVDNVLAEQTHSLNGRTIDPKRAMARGAVGGGGGAGAIKKVFVGGVDPNTSESTLRSHFERYGVIEEVALPYDKMKGMRKSFVFITFQSADSVELVCQESRQNIDGKDVEVKKATPKNDQRGGRGGFGGRGGGRGGGYGQYGGRGGGGGYGGYSQGGGWGSQGGGYGGGDYSSYGSNDYSSGGYGNYNQGYNQGGYGSYNSGGYGGGYGGDSYSGSGYKQRQDGSSGYGYHPYQR